MAVYSSAGARVYVAGVHAAATTTSGAYAALTWVEIGEVESIGTFGDEAAVNTFSNMADRRLRKLPGLLDGGTFVITCGHDAIDVGQIALKAAKANLPFSYDIKVLSADKADSNDTPTIIYFAGPVTSVRYEYGSNSNVTKVIFNIPINTAIVEVPAAAVP